MSQLNRLFGYVEAQRSRYLEGLKAYLRRPSISAHNQGIRENAQWLVGLLSDMGFKAQALETAGHPMVYGERLEAPGAPTVLFYGHYDVQPPEPLEAWHSPPFEPTVREGRLYARGAGDNKGQHYAQLMALHTWLEVEGRLPCNVKFLLEGEEEVGSPHIADFVQTHRDLLACDVVITSDGPIHESGRPTLEFGVRGIQVFELRARGANTDVHSGNWGGVVPNPIWTLVHLLATMKNPQGQITIEGFYDNVLPATPKQRQALDNLPLDETAIKNRLGLEHFDAPPERPYFDRLALYPTLTLNGIQAGYTGPGSKTVLPNYAVVKADIRLVEAMTLAEVRQKLKRHVQKHAPEVELIFGSGMEPSGTPLETPYAEPVRQALERAWQDEPLLVPAMGGSLPDYVFTKILGVPSLIVPYANADENNHAPNENIELELFYKGIKTGIALLHNIAQMPRP